MGINNFAKDLIKCLPIDLRNPLPSQRFPTTRSAHSSSANINNESIS